MKHRYSLHIKLGGAIALPMLIFSAVFIGMAFNTDDFDNLNNLSRTTKNELDSGIPHIKTDDAKIAVVWADGFNADKDTKEAGNIYLKSALEGNGQNEGYWRAKVLVNEGQVDANTWGRDPDFVFDVNNNNLVHIVWSQGSNCNNVIFNCEFETIQYRRCNISGNINTCEAIKLVAQGQPNQSMVNPKIAHDGTNLHVIWQVTSETAQTQDIFRYRRGDGNGNNWQGGEPIPGLEGGQDLQLLYNNGWLHIAWDEANAGTGQRVISYFRTDNLSSNQLSVQGKRSFDGFSVDYTGQDAGNPSLIGSGNWLFIGYDVRRREILGNPSNDKFFGLFYVMSDDNGATWTGELSIPDQDEPTAFESNRPDEADNALKPRLGISSTGTITQLNAVWHEKVQVGVGVVNKKYRVSFSSLQVDGLIGGGTSDWNTPEQITFPSVSELEDTVKDTEDIFIPNIAFTDFGSNPGTGNLTFQKGILGENPPPADAYYVGGISGTIDPEYILDEFVGPGGEESRGQFKSVTPSMVITSAVPPAPITLNYLIAFTNTGGLDAIGVSVTDTLPSNAIYNNDLNHTGPGSASYNPVDKTITWSGNLPKGQAVSLTFSVRTTNDLRLPDTVRNRLELWSIGAAEPVAINLVDTRVAGSVSFLPIIVR